MVFGFDEEDKSIFEDTLEFLMRNKIATVSFNVLTPYPGTKIYDRFKKEGRLLTEDWKYYDHSTVVFIPKNMTPQELMEGHIWVRREFYKISSIAKRLSHALSHPLLYTTMNFGYRKNIKEDVKNLKKEITRSQVIQGTENMSCGVAEQ